MYADEHHLLPRHVFKTVITIIIIIIITRAGRPLEPFLSCTILRLQSFCFLCSTWFTLDPPLGSPLRSSRLKGCQLSSSHAQSKSTSSFQFEFLCLPPSLFSGTGDSLPMSGS